MENNEAYQKAILLNEITKKGIYPLPDESKKVNLVFDTELSRKANEYSMQRRYGNGK